MIIFYDEQLPAVPALVEIYVAIVSLAAVFVAFCEFVEDFFFLSFVLTLRTIFVVVEAKTMPPPLVDGRPSPPPPPVVVAVPLIFKGAIASCMLLNLWDDFCFLDLFLVLVGCTAVATMPPVLNLFGLREAYCLF